MYLLTIVYVTLKYVASVDTADSFF